MPPPARDGGTLYVVRLSNDLMANDFLAKSPDDCRARAEGFRVRANNAQSDKQKKLWLYFAHHWDLLAREIADIVDSETAASASKEGHCSRDG